VLARRDRSTSNYARSERETVGGEGDMPHEVKEREGEERGKETRHFIGEGALSCYSWDGDKPDLSVYCGKKVKEEKRERRLLFSS